MTCKRLRERTCKCLKGEEDVLLQGQAKDEGVERSCSLHMPSGDSKIQN